MNAHSSVKRVRAPDLRRAQILDAAAIEFARAGFHASTMSDIAARAGVSAGLAYRYFSGKEAIIEALAARMRDVVLGWYEEAASSDDVVESLLRAANVEGIADATYSALYAEILAEASRNPKVQAILVETDRLLVERLQTLLRKARDRGRIAPEADLEVLSHLLFALADGVTVRAAAGLFSASWTRDARFVEGFRGLVASGWIRPTGRRPPRTPRRRGRART